MKFGDFFSLDGPLFKYGTLFADWVTLSILWAVCSIPIFTMGAATTALYYVTTRQVSDMEGYVSKDFFKSFKQNFFKSTFYFILILIITGLLFFNYYYFNHTAQRNDIMLVLQIVVFAELVGICVFLFPVIARFDLKPFQYVKNAFYFANRHISTTITCIVFFVLSVWLILKFILPVLVLPGLYAYFSSFFIMRVFRKYLPNMDRNIEEYKIETVDLNSENNTEENIGS